MNASVSEKGQVTIPKKLRERLGILPGDILDFDEDDGRLVAKKVAQDHPVDRIYGILKLARSSDELLGELRGDPDAV